MSTKIKWGGLPTVGTAGELLPYCNPREAQKMVMSLIEVAGGWERMLDILEKDPERFAKWFERAYLEQMPKAPAASVSVSVKETHVNVGELRSAITDLARRAGVDVEKLLGTGTPIDAEFTEVDDK